jgi:hypothetical protein
MTGKIIAIVGRSHTGDFYHREQLEMTPEAGYARFDLPQGTIIVEGHVGESDLPILQEFLVKSGVPGLESAEFHMVDTDYQRTIQIIQDSYFQLLRETFTVDVIEKLSILEGLELRRYIVDSLAGPRILLPFQKEPVTFMEYRMYSALIAVNEFWDQYAQPLTLALQRSNSYKVVLPLQEVGMRGFGVARRMGLYFDTLLITDPLHFNSTDLIADMASRPRRDSAAALAGLIEQFATMLKLGELRSRDVDHPIVAFVPDFAKFDEDALKRDASQYLVEALRVPNDQLTVNDFLEEPLSPAQVRRIHNAVAVSSNSHQLLQQFRTVPTGWHVNYLRDQHGRLEAEPGTNLSPVESILSLYSFLILKMYSFRSTTLASSVFKADPLTQIYLPEAYRWFVRIHGGDARYHPSAISEENAVSYALVQEDMAYWEAVSLETLRQVRESGQLADLRRDIRIERHKLRRYGPEELHVAAAAFTARARELVADHARTRRQLIRQQQSNVHWASASLVGSAALAGISIAFPAVALLGLAAAAISLIYGGKSIRDLVLMKKEAVQEIDELDGRSIALLYDASITNLDGK